MCGSPGFLRCAAVCLTTSCRRLLRKLHTARGRPTQATKKSRAFLADRVIYLVHRFKYARAMEPPHTHLANVISTKSSTSQVMSLQYVDQYINTNSGTIRYFKGHGM